MARKPRGPGAHHDDRRREIADAVLGVIADGGLEAVSLTQVAVRAGVSPGRVQHYFPTKDELIRAAFERANSLSAARIRDLVGTSDLDKADPRRVLTTVLTELIPYDEHTRLHLRVRQFFNAQALANEGIAEDLRPRYAALHADLGALITRAAPSMADAAEQTAVRLTGLVEGLAYYVLIGICTPDAALHQLKAVLGELADEAMLSRTADNTV